MYNAQSIKNFIDKVNEEAEAAAKAVYNKYQAEYERRLLAQIKKGDVIYAGMGTAFIDNSKGIEVGEKLGQVLRNNEYNKIRVGLSTPDKLKK